MRVRTFFLIALILLMAGFFTLNVDEFTRATTLNLGWPPFRCRWDCSCCCCWGWSL